jgi:hypothetical protein
LPKTPFSTTHSVPNHRFSYQNFNIYPPRRHPEVLELRERLRPLSRAETFGRIYNAGKTEVGLFL